MVYNGTGLYGGGTVSGGQVNPTPTHFTSGDVGGTIYRYVVWRNDPTCPDVTCPGSQDLKRVMVAIRLDGTPVGGSTRDYQELFKEVSNPATNPVNDPNPGPACTGGTDCVNGNCTGTDCIGGQHCTSGSNCNQGVCTGSDCSNDAIPWTFWLTEAPACNNSSRQPTTNPSSSTTRRRLRRRAEGLEQLHRRHGSRAASRCARPYLTAAPPLSGGTAALGLRHRLEPAPRPEDKGLQMPPPDCNGCLSSLFRPLTDPEGRSPQTRRHPHADDPQMGLAPDGDRFQRDACSATAP